MLLALLLAACGLSISGLAMAAETASDEAVCVVRDSSGAVTILICAADSTDADWRAAGAEACAEQQTCNAWVWLDGSKAPDAAPETDAGLPKEKTADAVAIWVSVAESLVLISRAN